MDNTQENTDPLRLFNQWFSEELQQSKLHLPAACCLSTLGLDGYPNSRFVSLKEVTLDAFVVTGPMDSRKGREIEHAPKASLSFWWTSTKRQVRIQGDVFKIPGTDAENYFSERNRDSKIVSTAFEQGKPISSIDRLQEVFLDQQLQWEGQQIQRPENWSGIRILPVRIEFMEFKESRLHQRTLYKKLNNQWNISILQP